MSNPLPSILFSSVVMVDLGSMCSNSGKCISGLLFHYPSLSWILLHTNHALWNVYHQDSSSHILCLQNYLELKYGQLEDGIPAWVWSGYIWEVAHRWRLPETACKRNSSNAGKWKYSLLPSFYNSFLSRKYFLF